MHRKFIDVAIPVHPKDVGTLHAAVSLLRRHCRQVRDVYIIGNETVRPHVETIPPPIATGDHGVDRSGR